MKIRDLTFAVFILAAVCTFSVTSAVYGIRGKYLEETISRIGSLPSPLLQALTLEFKGVAADFLLLKTISFMGMKIVEGQNPEKEEWLRMNDMLNRITDLDGRFWDPYLLAEMMFVWQAGMVDEANALLVKASEQKPDDYRPPYYLGFNYFYFKKDSNKAAVYLRQAAQRPEAPDYIKGLAARFSVYGNQTAIGIVFLEDLLQDTQDKNIKKYLEKRLIAMKSIYYLEQSVKEYKKIYEKTPSSLEELVAKGLLDEIPSDPYGGEFILMKNGRVYTTSQLVEKTAEK